MIELFIYSQTMTHDTVSVEDTLLLKLASTVNWFSHFLLFFGLTRVTVLVKVLKTVPDRRCRNRLG